MDKRVVLISLIIFFILIIPISFSDIYNLQHYQNSKSSFYTGGHPGKGTKYPNCDYSNLTSNLATLKTLGIKKVVVLGGECLNSTTGLSKSYVDILKESGFQVIYINMGAVVEENSKGYDSQITEAYSWLDSAKNDVYVHCWHGMHRTGAFVGKWLKLNDLVSEENANYQRILKDLQNVGTKKQNEQFTNWVIKTESKSTTPTELKLYNENYNGDQGYILEVDPTQYEIKIMSASTVMGAARAKVEDMVKKSGAIAGVNASFYNVNSGKDCSKPKESGVPLGLTIENKVEKSEYLGNNEWDCHLMNPPKFPNHFLVINNNIPEILSYSEYKSKYSTTKPDYALQSAALKYNNLNGCDLGSKYCNNKVHPATYVCVTNDNKLLLAVYAKAGATYPSSFDSKCKSIINLDGGGSSTLIIPSKNIKYFGYIDQADSSPRTVPNAILIFKKGITTQQDTQKEQTKKEEQTKAEIKSFCEVNSVTGNILCQVEKMLGVFFKVKAAGTSSVKNAISGKDFSFAVISDTHISPDEKNNTPYFEKALHIAKQHNVNFVIGLGDIISEKAELATGSQKTVLDAISKSGLLFLPVAGNHDYKAYKDMWASQKQYITTKLKQNNSSELNLTGDFPKYYAFTYNNIRVIVWYIVGSGSGGQIDIDWFVSELNNSKKYSNTLVFAHYPLEDVTYAKSQVNYNKGQIISSLQGANAIYFAGHTHVFYVSKTNNIEQVLVGTTSNRTQYYINGKNTKEFPKNFVIVKINNGNLVINPYSGNNFTKGFDTAQYWPSTIISSTISQSNLELVIS